METTASGWNVIDRAAGVLTRSYEFTRGATATTFVARLADGKLVVVSPGARLPDAALDELTTFGEVGALVANNGYHHLGQPAWRKRFPAARAFAPEQALARIGKKNREAGTLEPLSALAPLCGDGFGFREVPKTRAGESWYWTKLGDGHAWFASDMLANLPTLPPKFPVRQLFKWTGSAPGYRVFSLALRLLCKDKKGTLALLRDDIAAHPPTVMVPAHGDILARPSLPDDTRALLDAALR